MPSPIEVNNTIPRAFQINLGGVAIETLVPAHKASWGQLAYARDENIWYVVDYDPVLNILQWIVFAGGGGGGSSDPVMRAKFGTIGPVVLSGLAVQAMGDWSAPLADGDRVAVLSQGGPPDGTSPANGLYVAHAGAWVRPPDFDSGTEVKNGSLIVVEEGETLAQTVWELRPIPFADPIIVGTTPLRLNEVAGIGVTINYWVNAPGAQPRTRFTTIQSALDQANTDFLLDGARKNVYVLPGLPSGYVGDVKIPQGVNLIGLQESRGHGPLVVGTLSIDTVVPLSASISGIRFNGGALASGCVLQGIGALTLEFNQCEFSSTLNRGFRDLNTGVGTVSFEDCKISTPAGTSAMQASQVGNVYTLTDCEIDAASSADPALAGPNSVGNLFSGCKISGSKSAAAGSTTFAQCSFASTVASGLTVAGGASVTFESCRDNNAPVALPAYAGAGVFSRSGANVCVGAGLFDAAPTLQTKVLNATEVAMTMREESADFLVSTLVDLTVVTGLGPVVGATLPPLSSVPEGRHVRIKNGNPFVLIVNVIPQPVDSIDFMAPGAIFPVGGCIHLVAGRSLASGGTLSAPTWIRIDF